MARKTKTGSGVRGAGCETTSRTGTGATGKKRTATAHPRSIVTFRWQKHPGGRPTPRLRALAFEVLRRLGHGDVEVGVLVCDDPTIRSLNRHFRAKDAPTDVLSFPASFDQPEGATYLGDIAISLESARRQAAERGVVVERELEVLLLHALVHLSGFDHETDHGEMDALENDLRRELLR